MADLPKDYALQRIRVIPCGHLVVASCDCTVRRLANELATIHDWPQNSPNTDLAGEDRARWRQYLEEE